MGYHAIARTPAEAGIARRVMDAIRRIVQMLRLFDIETQKKLGLSAAQVFVLQKLGDGKGVSVNELARRTHTHQSSVSVVVQKLLARGLVGRDRSAKDGRQWCIFITKRGKAFVGAAPMPAQERLIEALGKLTPMTRKNLAVGLEKWVAQAAGTGAPPMFAFDHAAGSTRRKGKR
ncbi:MAG TPA: MarR family transcriptional regulator [Tepidisphaeraceae bacterium]|nr:MarR family transcriptional regulator [Tepidisphaeraceae bacterium]